VADKIKELGGKYTALSVEQGLLLQIKESIEEILPFLNEIAEKFSDKTAPFYIDAIYDVMRPLDLLAKNENCQNKVEVQAAVDAFNQKILVNYSTLINDTDQFVKLIVSGLQNLSRAADLEISSVDERLVQVSSELEATVSSINEIDEKAMPEIEKRTVLAKITEVVKATEGKLELQRTSTGHLQSLTSMLEELKKKIGLFLKSVHNTDQEQWKTQLSKMQQLLVQIVARAKPIVLTSSLLANFQEFSEEVMAGPGMQFSVERVGELIDEDPRQVPRDFKKKMQKDVSLLGIRKSAEKLQTTLTLIIKNVQHTVGVARGKEKQIGEELNSLREQMKQIKEGVKGGKLVQARSLSGTGKALQRKWDIRKYEELADERSQFLYLQQKIQKIVDIAGVLVKKFKGNPAQKNVTRLIKTNNKFTSLLRHPLLVDTSQEFLQVHAEFLNKSIHSEDDRAVFSGGTEPSREMFEQILDVKDRAKIDFASVANIPSHAEVAGFTSILFSTAKGRLSFVKEELARVETEIGTIEAGMDDDFRKLLAMRIKEMEADATRMRKILASLRQIQPLAVEAKKRKKGHGDIAEPLNKMFDVVKSLWGEPGVKNGMLLYNIAFTLFMKAVTPGELDEDISFGDAGMMEELGDRFNKEDLKRVEEFLTYKTSFDNSIRSIIEYARAEIRNISRLLGAKKLAIDQAKKSIKKHIPGKKKGGGGGGGQAEQPNRAVETVFKPTFSFEELAFISEIRGILKKQHSELAYDLKCFEVSLERIEKQRDEAQLRIASQLSPDSIKYLSRIKDPKQQRKALLRLFKDDRRERMEELLKDRDSYQITVNNGLTAKTYRENALAKLETMIIDARLLKEEGLKYPTLKTLHKNSEKLVDTKLVNVRKVQKLVWKYLEPLEKEIKAQDALGRRLERLLAERGK